MSELTEGDYRELYDYIKENLKECKAIDIVRQLQELETVSVAEEIDKESLKYSIKKKHLDDGQTSFFPSDDSIEQYVEQYCIRPMSGKELYRAAVDILETRLISGPKMAAAICKALQDDRSAEGEIVWRNEKANSLDEIEDSVNIIEEFSIMSAAEQEKVAEIISTLKKVLGEGIT